MTMHDIGWAVEEMRQGRTVWRKGWNGKGQYLGLVPGATTTEHILGNQGMTLPYVYLCTVQGDFVPWLCSQTDLLADDWMSE